MKNKPICNWVREQAVGFPHNPSEFPPKQPAAKSPLLIMWAWFGVNGSEVDRTLSDRGKMKLCTGACSDRAALLLAHVAFKSTKNALVWSGV